MTMPKQAQQINELPLALHFASNWGVSTGVGSRGISNSTVETDEQGRPVVRATVVTGIMREQAEVVARALDNDRELTDDGAHWQQFVQELFGARGRSATSGKQATLQAGEEKPSSANTEQSDAFQGTTARLISFTDAVLNEDPTTDDVTAAVSIAIDSETGTVKDNFFRTIERASGSVLTGGVQFLSSDHAGNPMTWTNEQQEAVRFVLTLAATLVRGIGSDRSAGDGECTVLVGEHARLEAEGSAAALGKVNQEQRTWCARQMDKYCPLDGDVRRAVRPPKLPVADEALTTAPIVNSGHTDGKRSDKSPAKDLFELPLILTLNSPVVSYEVPTSNEVRTLDFIRGTTLLPWVHRKLRAAAPDSQLVRDAVVTGDLFVSDATLVTPRDTGVPDEVISPYNFGAGIPVPLCLSRSKADGENATVVLNRMRGNPPKDDNEVEDTHVPLRGGFLYVHDASVTGEENMSVSFASPQTTGRQSSAHNAVTGATAESQLFLVRALAAGQKFGATVTMSDRLQRSLESGGINVQKLLCGEARLGVRKLSGTYGKALCEAGRLAKQPERPKYWGEEGPWDAHGTTTLWCVSDLLVRSVSLGHGGSAEDILRALELAGASLECVEAQDGLFSGAIRHRRVDSWSGGGHGEDGQPRPTRMAVRAGSVLRVKPAKDADLQAVTEALARIAATGLGDLRAQGYGRVMIGHPLLNAVRMSVRQLEDVGSKKNSSTAHNDGTEGGAEK